MSNHPGMIDVLAKSSPAFRAANAHLLGAPVATPGPAVAGTRVRQSRDKLNKLESDATGFFVASGLPKPQREHRFAAPRRWRFDYAWPVLRIALEVEGGVWTGGRHTRGTGFLNDMEKYNAAAVLGWRVVRCTPNTVKGGATVHMLRTLLG